MQGLFVLSLLISWLLVFSKNTTHFCYDAPLYLAISVTVKISDLKIGISFLVWISVQGSRGKTFHSVLISESLQMIRLSILQSLKSILHLVLIDQFPHSFLFRRTHLVSFLIDTLLHNVTVAIHFVFPSTMPLKFVLIWGYVRSSSPLTILSCATIIIFVCLLLYLNTHFEGNIDSQLVEHGSIIGHRHVGFASIRLS